MLRITEPFHGSVLNRRHGEEVSGGLKIVVRGEAPPYGQVAVNGEPAQLAGGWFEAPVVLRERETDIEAVYDGAYGHQEHRVRVVWDRNSRPRYRFSVDDNSFWWRDLIQQEYGRLFDSWYLAMFRRLHEEYGAKFVLNIYYETEDGFQLPQVSDRYRGEWEECSEWLKLAFHARANLPDRPYQYASGERLIGDLRLVKEQIIRFAGEQTYSPPTVIHWGMVPPPALPRLAEEGVRVLSGFFGLRAGGHDINYFLDDVRSEQVRVHDCLMDFDTGIVFSQVDIVCNNTPLEQIEPTLAPLLEDPHRAEIMDLFTHEQYFWDFYRNYIPDHPQRIEAAIRFVTEHGYEPVLFHEGFLGAPE